MYYFVLEVISNDQLIWTHISDLKQEDKTAKRYSVQANQQNLLIDPTSKTVVNNLRSYELRTTVDRFLAQP